MKTILIKGKPYVEVKERVKNFRDKYPEYNIQTKIEQIDPDKYVIVKAWIQNANGNIFSTGHAMEEKKGNINTSSMVENCETSAVGRALGLFGIGIDAAIASADEMISTKPNWWPDAIKYLTEDGGTMEAIKKKYSLTEDLEKQLKEDAAKSL